MNRAAAPGFCLHALAKSNRYSIIRNRAKQLKTNEKTFSNRYFFGRFGLQLQIRQSGDWR
jgi:hypothetical protein